MALLSFVRSRQANLVHNVVAGDTNELENDIDEPRVVCDMSLREQCNFKDLVQCMSSIYKYKHYDKRVPPELCTLPSPGT